MTRLLGSRVVRLAIAVGLTAYLLWRNDPGAIARVAAAPTPTGCVLACALVVVDRALMAWRWLALLGPVMTTPPPVGAVLRVFFVSSFVGTFLPASVGGDAVRAYGLREHGVPGSAAVASVVMDRVLGVVAILLVGLVSVARADRAGAAGRLRGAAGRRRGEPGAGGGDLHRPGRRPGRPRAWPGCPARRFAPSPPGCSAPSAPIGIITRALAGVLAASIGVQVLRVLQAWCLGRALGIDAGLAVYFVVIPVVLLIMLLPITINGLGTGQAAFLWTFGAAGVAEPEALALSILFIALGILGNLPGGVLYAVGGRRPA